MKLITLIPVNHADVSKLLTGGGKQGFVRLEVGNRNLIFRNGNYIIEAEFKYFDEENNTLPTQDNGTFSINGQEQIKQVSQSINNIIPETNNIIDRFDEEVKAVAIYQMSLSFGISTNEIGDYIEQQ